MVTSAIWILIFSTALACVVSALHYALRDFSMVRLQTLAAAKGPGTLVESVLDDVDGHALATGAVRVLCNVAITVCSVVLLDVFQPDPENPAGIALSPASLAWACALSAVLIYVFAILLPLSIAEHAGERLICSAALPLRLLHWVAWPIRALGVIDIAIRRLAGADHVTETEKLEEEIISVVAEGEREGQLGETQRDMIEAVVDFRDRTVDQIMTPRTEIEGFEYTDNLAFIRNFVEKGGYSRIPVFQNDLDHIVGVLYAKDLIPFLGTDTANFKLKPILRRPVWVPETKSLMELLYELRARKVHLAIVADEYGGTAGLVTFEDLLEEIVGEIQDEYEPQNDPVADIDVNAESRSAEVEGRAYITDVNDALEPLGVEVPSSEEYDTVGGYVLARLGHIPVVGEEIREEKFLVRVLGAEPTRVTRLRIERLDAPGEGEQALDAAEEPDEPLRPSNGAAPRIAGA